MSGYNFKMSYSSLADTPDDRRIFLEVIGISPDENFAHIDFDAVTEEVLLAQEKIEYQKGEVEWKEFNLGQLLEYSNSSDRLLHLYE